MEYEKKYKDALERASKIYHSEFKPDEAAVLAEYLPVIFPELKESEDEKIRKTIIRFFKDNYPNETEMYDGSVTVGKALAWLEKQGNKSVNIDVESMVSSYEQRLESQGGTKYTPLVNMCLTSFRHGVENVLEELNLKKLEKQGEKKPADKITPKFKVGDFITNDYCLGKVIEITNDAYLLDTGQGIPFSCEHNAHLWTIKDAEDGDVLINWNNTTFIFKAIEDETVKFHIAYNESWDTIKTPSTKLSHLGLPEPQFEFHPAAKEQRELLFEKMNEAEYEWDAEKKEVKKIEVISKENEDEQIKKEIIHILKGETRYTSKEDADKYVDWLEKQKGD